MDTSHQVSRHESHEGLTPRLLDGDTPKSTGMLQMNDPSGNMERLSGLQRQAHGIAQEQLVTPPAMDDENNTAASAASNVVVCCCRIFIDSSTSLKRVLEFR